MQVADGIALLLHEGGTPDAATGICICCQFCLGHTRSVSAFSFLRQLQTRHCPYLLLRAVLRPRAAAAPAAQQLIDMSCLSGAQQQTRRTILQRANGTDRRTIRHTDTVPLHRHRFA